MKMGADDNIYVWWDNIEQYRLVHLNKFYPLKSGTKQKITLPSIIFFTLLL